MSEYQDVEQIRDRQGYIIAFQALDVVTGEPVVLKAKNGALQVDLVEMEQVQISLPDGANLNVEVQNTDPIPVDLPVERVVDVEVKNTDPIPVDLPAEKVVDVEVQNTVPIPVDLPVERVVDVEVKNTDPIPVDLPAEKVVDVEVQNTDPIPVEFGSAPDVVIPGGVAVTNFPSGFEVSNFPSPLTDDVVAVAPVVGEKTITQTAAALFAGASPLASRQFMRVHNLSLEQQILVGPSTVANTGFPIEPGGEVLLKFNKEVPVALYGISSGAAAKVRVMEA